MPPVRHAPNRIDTKSCLLCRTRKSQCDGQKPCGKCKAYHKECIYPEVFQKSRAVAIASQPGNAEPSGSTENLERHPPSERTEPSTGDAGNGEPSTSAANNPPSSLGSATDETSTVQFVERAPERPSLDTSSYLSVDELGNCSSFGPSSPWQSDGNTSNPISTRDRANIQNSLVANAALTRQQEHRLTQVDQVDSVPIELAIHLLELHWNREHHTFLLTYRPAIIRGLLDRGQPGSRFLLQCIFASAEKFSSRPGLSESSHNGNSPFLRRCDELLTRENILLNPSIPSVAGLLLLGSTYVARGDTTRGWLLTGYAFRMVYDLGLHIEQKDLQDEIEGEIRKRVFWGAFVYDKLQSLYLGRPFAIKLRDIHMPLEFNDIMEENELWKPYVDPACPNAIQPTPPPMNQLPIYSISCFQQLCLLAKIMARIIDEFYMIGATAAGAERSLREIDNSLREWEQNLPDPLQVRVTEEGLITSFHTPNVLSLHIIYNTLIILLHRPLVADGHLRSASPPVTSWERCSVAAKQITNTIWSFSQLYGLRSAPFMISYGLYVACTIHVRNVSMNPNGAGCYRFLLDHSLNWLQVLSIPNPAVGTMVFILRNLMISRGVLIPARIGYADARFQGHASQNLVSQPALQNMVALPAIPLHMDNGTGGPSNAGNVPFSNDLIYGFLADQLPISDVVLV